MYDNISIGCRLWVDSGLGGYNTIYLFYGEVLTILSFLTNVEALRAVYTLLRRHVAPSPPYNFSLYSLVSDQKDNQLILSVIQLEIYLGIQ